MSTDDDNYAAALALIDGLLSRMDHESARELRVSTTTLLAILRDRPVPAEVRAQLDALEAQLASELRMWWGEKQRVERELAEWIERKAAAQAAQRTDLVAGARERADELITYVSELEVTCTDLQQQLLELGQLLQRR